MCGAGTSAGAPPADPILAAIQAEVARTLTELRLPDSPAPYFVACTLERRTHAWASAALGAVTRAHEGRSAHLAIELRVGDYTLDDSNFVPKRSWGGGSRLDWPLATPLDDHPEELRRAIWWSMDQAYKAAVENYRRKQTVMAHQTAPPPADDFARAPVWTWTDSAPPPPPPSLARLTDRVRELSGVLTACRRVQAGEADVSVATTERWYVNSEGTRLHWIEPHATLTASAVAQADDGVRVGDSVQWPALSEVQWPSPEAQRTAVAELGRRVEALRAAPLLDDFAGPVLFEGQASAVVCARVLSDAFASRREPLMEDEAGGRWMLGRDEQGSLRRKLGRRVMAANFTVVDDPTLSAYEGQPLVGARAADVEGVKSERVALVQNGILKALLTTRTPDKKMPVSNGHAVSYASGPSGGEVQAGITCLLVRYENGLEERALRERLLQAIKDQDAEFGLLVRRMPSQPLWLGGERISLGAAGGDEESVIADPLYAFRVFPDGREELVRVVALKGIGVPAFKDVLAAGRQAHVFNYHDGRRRFSLVCPSLLFEEGLVVKPERNLAKPPLLPSPLEK